MAQATALSDLTLPYNGKIWQPPRKKNEVVFILVHQYGGNTRSLMRHIRMINQLGMAAVSFELGGAHNQKVFFPPLSRQKKWGLRHVWADRIEDILNLIPGQKIVFSLSNPSFATIEAVHRTKHKNILGLIFDGGPFFDVEKCYWNLFTHAFPTPLLLRFPQMVAGVLYWNTWQYKKKTRGHLESFMQEIPSLVFRAEKDILVPVKSIDKVFAEYPQKNLTQVLVKEAGHLMSIKLFPDLYKENLINFLEKKLNLPLS